MTGMFGLSKADKKDIDDSLDIVLGKDLKRKDLDL